MRKTLTDKGVAALKPRAARYTFPDPELRSHYIRVQPSGAKSYAAVTLDPYGKQVWVTIGRTEYLSINEARERARDAIQRIKDGKPAFEPPPVKPESFQEVANGWLKRHVGAKGLRSKAEITRVLEIQVYPAWQGRAFVDIRRSDVTALLDKIEDDHGARAADYVLAIVRGISNWFASRHDDYMPPIVKGMRRTVAKERERSRILADDELRAIWAACDGEGAFGAAVRVCLLTAQRRTKVFNMRWDDIADGEWTIAAEPREKNTAGVLVLPKMARRIIEAQPKFADNPFVFAGRGKGALGGMSKPKERLDQASGVRDWVLHDLRRSARSLMSRAGVSSEHAERVMGHVIAGVEGVYDRHQYRDEKADALARLAALIDAIVNECSADVLSMKGKRHEKGAARR